MVDRRFGTLGSGGSFEDVDIWRKGWWLYYINGRSLGILCL